MACGCFLPSQFPQAVQVADGITAEHVQLECTSFVISHTLSFSWENYNPKKGIDKSLTFLVSLKIFKWLSVAHATSTATNVTKSQFSKMIEQKSDMIQKVHVGRTET